MTDKQHECVFCWNELTTSDTKKAKEFYGNLLGWTYHDHDMGDMKYTIIKAGDKDVGGMMTLPSDKQGIPPHWMSYISVKDLDKTVQKAQSLGGTVKVPGTDVEGMGRFAIIQDPTGAFIAFW